MREGEHIASTNGRANAHNSAHGDTGRAETREHLGGFFMVGAKNLDDAIAIAELFPWRAGHRRSAAGDRDRGSSNRLDSPPQKSACATRLTRDAGSSTSLIYFALT
jgi:hypothetical protein